jgi:hypothetical protein
MKWGVPVYSAGAQIAFLFSYWLLSFSSMGEAEKVGAALSVVIGCAAGSVLDDLRTFIEKRDK